MKYFKRQYRCGKHLLDILPMLVIAIVCSLMLVTVAQGFWAKFDENALGDHAVSADKAPPDAGFANDASYSAWYNDASGYEEAVAVHEKTKKPMLVYFYAPWCGYCANFHKQILSNSQTVEALKDYLKVRVYPGPGAKANEALMSAFGASGFPTLFIKRANDPSYIQVNIYGRGGDLLTPSQFIERLKTVK